MKGGRASVGRNVKSWIDKDYVTRISEYVCTDLYSFLCVVCVCYSGCANVRRHAAMRFRCRYYVHMNVFPVRVM